MAPAPEYILKGERESKKASRMAGDDEALQEAVTLSGALRVQWGRKDKEQFAH